MNFKQYYLREVFDTEARIQWLQKNHAVIYIGEDIFHFYSEIVGKIAEYGKIYQISFSDKSGSFEKYLDVENPFKVFSGIQQAFFQWINEINPDNFYFTAKRKSRIKLYNSFAKKIENKTKYKIDYDFEYDLVDKGYVDVEDDFEIYGFTK